MVEKLSKVRSKQDVQEEEEMFQLFYQTIGTIRRTLRHAETQARCVPNNSTAHAEWLVYDTTQAISSQTLSDLGEIVNELKAYRPLYSRPNKNKTISQ